MGSDTSSDEQLVNRFDRITVYSRGSVRAPNKPLLLLMALANVKNGGDRWLRFNAASKRLTELLLTFGPPTKSPRTDHPYWRLSNDGVWELPELAQLAAKKNKAGDIPITALRELDARAGFPNEIHERLSKSPALVTRLARDLVEKHFAEPKRDDVLRAVGRTRCRPPMADAVVGC